MVNVIIIKTSGDLFHAVRTLNRIKRKLPEMTRLAMRRWGNTLARDMKRSARNSGIKKFSGTLQGLGIRWEQGVRSNEGYLFMRLYAIYLDSMAPHYVNITRRRTRLLAWGINSRSSIIRKKSAMVSRKELKSFAIYVKPHPFIAQGYRVARPKLKPILKQMTKRGIYA